MQARDGEGNNIRVGGDKVTGSVAHKTVPVVDCGDGTYHFTVTETLSGPFDLHLAHSGETHTLTGQVRRLALIQLPQTHPPLSSHSGSALLTRVLTGAGRSHVCDAVHLTLRQCVAHTRAHGCWQVPRV
jgi:hypothetical protein